jgi:hypothetical protein
VIVQGFSANGVVLNRVVAQVAQASSASFTVGLPFTPYVPLTGNTTMVGTFTDSGTATTINVALALDSFARNQQEISNIFLNSAPELALSHSAGVNIYFGSRVDAGSRLMNTWASSALYFDYYFSAGGINVQFDNGWRADGAGLADIYWRVVSGDNFRIANGTANVSVNNNGAALMLDASSCDLGNVEGTLSHVDMESDQFNIASGLGIITLYDCGGSNFNTQFFLNLDGVTQSETSSVFNPGIVMSPANDLALQLTAVNSSIDGGSAGNRWVGLPAIARTDMGGSNGWESLLNYSPSINSIGVSNYSSGAAGYNAPTQLASDVNLSQVWQYGIKASDFLYADTAFAALPNGTTLFAGQILAPPSYWNGVNGNRYAIDVVYQSGTTGLPNSGATTCQTSAVASQFVCSSATDLSAGQYISVGSATNKQIKYIDATNPTSILVWTTSTVGTISTPTSLAFASPLIGPEMQLATKSASAPASLSWSQGDMEQNSGATANGVAAWVNVAAGTPGTWAAVPLGNGSGQITPAQITTPSTTVNGTTCTLGSSCTVAAAPTLTVVAAAGDLACAMAADTSIGSTAITGGSTSGSAATLNFSSAPNYYYVGQKVGVAGATPSGLIGGPYTITAVTTTSITFASAVASGSVSSGGTAYLWCKNQSTDWTSISSSRQWANAYTVPASYFATSPRLTMGFNFDVWASSTQPAFGVQLFLGSQEVYGSRTTTALPAGTNASSGALHFEMLGLTSTEAITNITSVTFPTTSVSGNFSNALAQPQSITSASATLGMAGYWAQTGVASITSSSGCTVTGSIGQTVLLTGLNNSSTATATGTLTAANTIAGATWVVTSRGQGATAAPTSATCSAGTVSSASGTATLTTTLGGTPGNAALLLALTVGP